MDWLIYVICAVLGYLIGNIQTGVILSNTVFKSDIRDMGSGNSGATNMMRMFGLKSGLLTFFGDVLKTVVAILIAWLIGGDKAQLCGYIAALAVVLGHDFPAFFAFHGGKGIASTVAVMWMITPFPEALITNLIGIALIILTRLMSLSVLTALACYVVMIVLWHLSSDLPLVILAGLLLVIALIRHAENIKRIIHGNERKLKFSKKGEKQQETEANQ